nr:MAG TPA: hypothetical protein [Caudoviricetes sp.]
MKSIIIGVLIGIIVGMLGTAYADGELKFIDGYNAIQIYTDEDTKIQYIVVESFRSNSISICPRYTSSGNLYYVGSEAVEK